MPNPIDKNIRPRDPADVMWNAADPVQSLREIRKDVEQEAQKVIDWYWRSKRSKSALSRFIQLFALVLTALAGIVPIVIQVLRGAGVNFGATFDSGAIASLSIGIAAALVGLDKAFGFSTGWTRYVLTATYTTKLLHEFRLDWVALIVAAKDVPTVEQQAGLIQRAKDFISAVQGMVMQETKDWATEFQSNMAQMEKDLKTQLDSLKAQVEKDQKDKEGASKPGAIELALTNADKTDDFRFDVTAEGPAGKSIESVSGSKAWTCINMAPGQYKVTLGAKSKGNPVATSTVVEVKPGETAKPSVALPIT